MATQGNNIEQDEVEEQDPYWHAKVVAQEARWWRLMREGKCPRCESTDTANVSDEFDACEVRRCFDCGYRYACEL